MLCSCLFTGPSAWVIDKISIFQANWLKLNTRKMSKGLVGRVPISIFVRIGKKWLRSPVKRSGGQCPPLNCTHQGCPTPPLWGPHFLAEGSHLQPTPCSLLYALLYPKIHPVLSCPVHHSAISIQDGFYRTQVNLGSDSWVRMSVTPSKTFVQT